MRSCFCHNSDVLSSDVTGKSVAEMDDCTGKSETAVAAAHLVTSTIGSDTVVAFAANVRMTGMSTGSGDVDYNVGNCNVMVPSSLQTPPPLPFPLSPFPRISSGSRQMQVSVIHERLLHYFLTAHLPQRIIQPEAALSWSLNSTQHTQPPTPWFS